MPLFKVARYLKAVKKSAASAGFFGARDAGNAVPFVLVAEALESGVRVEDVPKFGAEFLWKIAAPCGGREGTAALPISMRQSRSPPMVQIAKVRPRP